MHGDLPDRTAAASSGYEDGAGGSDLSSSAAMWLAGFGLLIAAIYLASPLSGTPRVAVGNALLLLASLGAAAAAVAAARAAPAGHRVPWLLFGAGALSAASGQLLWAVQEWAYRQPMAFPSASYALFILFHPLFIIGAALALSPSRSRGVALEAGLDALLMVAAAAVLVMRFGFEPLLADASITRTQITAALLGQLLSLLSLFCAGLLAIAREAPFPGRSTAAIVVGIALFAAGNFLVHAGFDPDPTRVGTTFDLVWLSGWGFLIYAGLVAAREPVASSPLLEPRSLPNRLRHAAVPSAAVLLGLAAIDAALRATISIPVAAALAVVSALLAARTAQALTIVRRQTDEGRRLAHTRALVEVSRALACSTELDATLELVSQWASRLLGARAAGIELLSDDGQTLELRASVGLPTHIHGLRFPVDRSFTGWVVIHGEPRATANPQADPFIQPQSLSFLGEEPTAAAPLVFRDTPLGALFACIRDRPFDASDLELLRALADQAAIAIENARLFEQVRALSLTDPLTGLANRRQLERELAREFAAARRGRKLVIVIFDLDAFKEYNDTYGHVAGDQALRSFGEVLAMETRSMNLAARYGGDEFIAVLSDSEPERAQIFVDRVRHRFPREVGELGRGELTVSAGMAAYDESMKTPDDLLTAADRALYQEKGSRASR